MSRICQLDICPRLPTNKILDSNGNGLTTEASVVWLGRLGSNTADSGPKPRLWWSGHWTIIAIAVIDLHFPAQQLRNMPRWD